MSLLDSLLLEGYRDPREIWIALRTDGQMGSGTIDDPFHGGVIEAPPIGVSLSLVVGTNPREIIATTASAHGYIEGDIVVLSCTRDSTGAPAPSFDGPYQIKVAGPNQFKCYLDFPTTTDFSGTAVSVKRIFLLDQLFRSLTQSNLAIHIGPGVFETRGNAGYVNIGNQGWEVREGWKIRGSGINVTTVKLADSRGAPNGQLYLPIGSQTWYILADYAEASDLTIDCNAEGNRTSTVGAIFLTGSHTRIRRVRAINWGPQGPPESFVINVGGSHPFLPEITDCVIEDCIADQPGLNNTHETTILGITGSPSVAADGKPGIFRGGAIRRNVVDANYSRNEVPIQSIELASGKAVVTTAVPHGRATGDWVVIAGAVVDGTELNGFNGSCSISNVSSTGFEYTPSPVPGSNPIGTMFVDRFASHWVVVDPGTDLDRGIQQVSGLTYKLRTVTPHNRIPGNNIVINGVVVEGFGTTNAFNGSFLIVDVGPSPKELKFTLVKTAEGPIDWPNSTPYIGVTFHVGAGIGTCQVVEHNRVIGTTVGVYGDSFSTKSLHVRNNHFHNMSLRGFYRNLGNYLSPLGPIVNVHGLEGSCLSYSLEGVQHIATFTALEPLVGLNVGDRITIGGACVPYGFTENNPYSSLDDLNQGENHNPDNPYNSTAANPTYISALPSPNQFKYVLPRRPGLGNSNPNSNPDLVPSNAGGSPVFSVGATLNVVTAESLVRASTTQAPKRVKFTTPTGQPHNFQVGDIISVFGVKMMPGTSGTFNPFLNPYNGVFQVSEVEEVDPGDPTYIFYYETLIAASADALSNPAPQCARQVGTALTRNGTTATFQTISPHFLSVGQIIWIDSALVKGIASNPFNGRNLAVKSVGPTLFRYEMSDFPVTDAYGPTGYQGKDAEGALHFENNIIEILANAPVHAAYAVNMGGGDDFRPNYIFRQVAIRGNLIRHMDNAADSYSEYSGAIACYNCGALLIDNNVIALDHTSPIRFALSGMVNCVNNRTPQGALIKANDLATGQFVDSYFPAAEEAFVFTLL